MTDIIGDSACPQCVAAGRDNTGNHLILFSDGGSYCNRCAYSEGSGTFTKPSPNFGKQLSPEEARAEVKKAFEESTVQAIKSRGLSLRASEHFGVRVTLSEQDGETQTSVLFPGWKDHQRTGFKVAYPGKNFGTVGDRKGVDFFGADVCPKNGNKLFITEGEYDCMALYDILWENSKPEWRNSIAVVSLFNGAASADKESIRNRELLEGFKEIVLVLDQDEEGRKAVDKIVNVLGREKVKAVKFNEKDANKMLNEGKGRELYFACITERSIPRPEKVISGNDMSMDDLLVPLKKGCESPYPKLNEMLGGFRHGNGGGELTVVCAGAGMGKTTAAREIMYHFNNKHQMKLGHIFLEEQFRKTGQSYIATDNNVPLAALRADPGIIKPASFRASYDKLIGNGRTFFLKHFGSLASEHLIDYMQYMGVQEGCDFVMLDHISMVISGQENGKNGERKDIDILMTKLAAFCEDTGVSVIAIVHLKRPQNGCFNDGQQISLAHLRGSAAIEQLSHNIIGIEGDQHGDNPNGRIIRVLKNREWGAVGEADELIYRPETGRLLPDQINFGGEERF